MRPCLFPVILWPVVPPKSKELKNAPADSIPKLLVEYDSVSFVEYKSASTAWFLMRVAEIFDDA